MAAYETYKDSGVKWLGTIPSHWTVLPGKAVCVENKTKNSSNDSKTVLSLSYGNIIVKPKVNEGLVPENYSGYQIVKPNYIIIRCTDLQNDKTSLRTGFVKDDGIISGAYLGLIPNENVNPKFFHLFLHNWDVTKEIYRHGSGLRQSLSWNDIKCLQILIPPIAEQEAIVAYLDKATGEIDRAIEVQQQMIDALNERIQIIISRAVIKGLNLDAKIGKDGFPAHWEVFPLRYAMSIRNGYTPSKANPAFWENGTIPWYRMEDIRKSGRMLNEAIQCVTPKAVKSAGTFDAGSFILAICTASIGEHAMLIADSLANQRFANLKIRKSLSARINPMFMFYYMYVIGDFCRNNANSTCFQYVDMSGLKRFPVPIPRPEEQEAIVDYLNTNTAGIKQQIANCQRMIDLLTERKQIIINQVVTGKEKVI